MPENKKRDLKKEISGLEEIDLDTLSEALEHFEDIDEEVFDELEAEEAALLLESGIGNEDDLEVLEEIGVLKKDRGLKRLPIDRENDKRRVGKGMQKFIDTEVPEEILNGMTPEVQELMKK